MDSVMTFVLNIFMSKLGYSDPQIAGFISWRYLAGLLLAIPLGIFIKDKKLKPFFWAYTLILTSSVLLVVWAIEAQNTTIIHFAFSCIGIAVGGRHIITLPYILRNVVKENHTMVISLSFATWSLGTIFSGLVLNGLVAIDPIIFNEKTIIQLFCGLSLLAVVSLLLMKQKEYVPPIVISTKSRMRQYDWGLMAQAAFPIVMIAIGAGLTIPYMNLFFFHTFDIDFNNFALMGTVTAFLVFGVMLVVPEIKERFGYHAITWTQTIAVVLLFALGTTDFISHWIGAVVLAIVCYIFRQPLMSLANPMTSEMTMYYVGERNRELMAAVISSIWAGSWFFSSLIFRQLRVMEVSYGYVFYITAALYLGGVISYAFLIRKYYQKELKSI